MQLNIIGTDWKLCGCHGLSEAKMKKITHGARCPIKMHSTTGDVAALCHDLRNDVRHYFGDNRKCNSIYCNNTNTLRVKHGPGWTASVLMAMDNTSELNLLDQLFTNRRKRKHVKDSARKNSLKYK